MSCPDWRGLDPASHDAAAEAALRHLDSGCQRCWQEALALDPTLIFRRLPVPINVPPVPSPATNADTSSSSSRISSAVPL